MDLNSKYEILFSSMPKAIEQKPTFLEIAGFPHYENVCSNILRFFLNPANVKHGLNDILLSSLLRCVESYQPPFLDYSNITIRREYPTNAGRIDLVLFNSKWVIAIENKIFHQLNNDLKEYADFIDAQFPDHKKIKIVLSIRNEKQNLSGGFINVTYEQLIRNIDASLDRSIGLQSEYYVLFKHFIETIKKFYMSVKLSEEELAFLDRHMDQINDLIELRQKLDLYINQRANRIKDMVNVPYDMEKWVFANYDVGFHYTYQDVRFKIECPIDLNGIQITICVEINKVDKAQLERLDFFKKRKIENFESNEEGTRLFLEKEKIPFSISDEELAAKIETILKEIKISE